MWQDIKREKMEAEERGETGTWELRNGTDREQRA